MKLLLDTHTFLWSISGQKLSQNAQDAFLDANNELFLSAVSYWEICIKQSIGKLGLAANWVQVFDQEMQFNHIQWLPIEKSHCQKIGELPFLHGDPFDRLLITQAMVEEMTLLTADSNIHQYPISALW